MTDLQVLGTGVVALLAIAFGAPVLIDTLMRQWRDANEEDEAWRRSFGELGPDSVGIVGLDTRLIRPWGESAAVERFVVKARELGHDWLEPATADLQADVPLSLRAIAGEVEGTKAAFLVARTRRQGVVVKRIVLGPAGVVTELAPECMAPPPGFAWNLARLAVRAKVPA